MYQGHFGLQRPPFKITPDTSLFYEGSQRGAALDALMYAISSGEGITKVVGEVGCGKTMMCRMLEVRLGDSVDVVYIANPSLSPDNILHVIAHELGLDVENSSSKLDVMQQISVYLLERHAKNRQVVLFVEEAQSMPIETLEEIRLLSNLETEQHKLLQMVLFGQPELDDTLAKPHIRQLKERITHSFYLEPFPPKDILEYLNFRLRNVGYHGPDVFNKKTASAIEKYSAGLTRRINILADKALMASFSEGGHEVTVKHVHAAAIDSDFTQKRNWQLWLMVAAVVAGLGIAVWLGTMIARPNAEPEVQASASTIIEKGETEAVLPIANDSALEVRVLATSKWLDDALASHYSIQLFMTRLDDADGVEKFLLERPEMLDLEQIYIYETQIDGIPMYSVVYGDFVSSKQARTILHSFPVGLQQSKPYPRRISSLR